MNIKIKELLGEAWQKFLLWNLLGKPPHAYEYNGQQYWYDPYYTQVEFEPDNCNKKSTRIGTASRSGGGIVYFAIQIADAVSISGETWILAEVPLEAGRLIFEMGKYQLANAPSYIWAPISLHELEKKLKEVRV